MNILLLGGSGFIGRHLAARLRACAPAGIKYKRQATANSTCARWMNAPPAPCCTARMRW